MSRNRSKERRKKRREKSRKKLGALIGLHHVVEIEQGKVSVSDVLERSVTLSPEERDRVIALSEQLTGE